MLTFKTIGKLMFFFFVIIRNCWNCWLQTPRNSFCSNIHLSRFWRQFYRVLFWTQTCVFSRNCRLYPIFFFWTKSNIKDHLEIRKYSSYTKKICCCFPNHLLQNIEKCLQGASINLSLPRWTHINWFFQEDYFLLR